MNIAIDFDNFLASLYKDNTFTDEQVSGLLTLIHGYSKTHDYPILVIVQDNQRPDMQQETFEKFSIVFSGSNLTVAEIIKNLTPGFNPVIVSDKNDFDELKESGSSVMPSLKFYNLLVENLPLS